MIQINKVSKSYKKDNNVINDISLTVNDGEIFGFLGPNGAGKTTTIKMITGILGIDKGEIFIDGYSITKNPIEAKKRFSFVPDNPDIFLKLKGIEYLNFLADVYDISTNDRIERINKLSKEFDMESALENKIQSYSHGMRQKIVIIGALLHETNNLILDEPMTGLDPKASFDFKKIMRNYASDNKTVFFSTHILEVAEKLCDRVAIINNGNILFVGTYEDMKKEFKTNASLEDLFMEITENE